MKKLSLFTIVITLCLGAAAMIQSGRASDGRQSSGAAVSHAPAHLFAMGFIWAG